MEAEERVVVAVISHDLGWDRLAEQTRGTGCIPTNLVMMVLGDKTEQCFQPTRLQPDLIVSDCITALVFIVILSCKL